MLSGWASRQPRPPGLVPGGSGLFWTPGSTSPEVPPMLRACLLAAAIAVVGCGKKGTPTSAAEVEQTPGLNEWSQVGDIRLRIVAVKVQKVRIITPIGETQITKQPQLMVWIEV